MVFILVLVLVLGWQTKDNWQVTDPQINDFAASNLCLALEENKSLKSLNLEVEIESNETKIKSNKTGGKNRTKSNQIKSNQPGGETCRGTKSNQNKIKPKSNQIKQTWR